MSIFARNKLWVAAYGLFDMASISGNKDQEKSVLRAMAAVLQQKDEAGYNKTFGKLIANCLEDKQYNSNLTQVKQALRSYRGAAEGALKEVDAMVGRGWDQSRSTEDAAKAAIEAIEVASASKPEATKISAARKASVAEGFHITAPSAAPLKKTPGNGGAKPASKWTISEEGSNAEPDPKLVALMPKHIRKMRGLLTLEEIAAERATRSGGNAEETAPQAVPGRKSAFLSSIAGLKKEGEDMDDGARPKPAPVEEAKLEPTRSGSTVRSNRLSSDKSWAAGVEESKAHSPKSKDTGTLVDEIVSRAIATLLTSGKFTKLRDNEAKDQLPAGAAQGDGMKQKIAAVIKKSNLSSDYLTASKDAIAGELAGYLNTVGTGPKTAFTVSKTNLDDFAEHLQIKNKFYKDPSLLAQVNHLYTSLKTHKIEVKESINLGKEGAYFNDLYSDPKGALAAGTEEHKAEKIIRFMECVAQDKQAFKNKGTGPKDAFSIEQQTALSSLKNACKTEGMAR